MAEILLERGSVRVVDCNPLSHTHDHVFVVEVSASNDAMGVPQWRPPGLDGRLDYKDAVTIMGNEIVRLRRLIGGAR